MKDEAKVVAAEDVIKEELEADIDADLDLKEQLEYDNNQLEYQIEAKEDELEDKEEKTEDDEIIFDQGEIIKQQSEENQKLQDWFSFIFKRNVFFDITVNIYLTCYMALDIIAYES